MYRNKYTREFIFQSANDSIQHDRTNYLLPEIRVMFVTLGVDRTKEKDLIIRKGNYSNGIEDVLLVEFMYLVFTRMPGESYRRRLRSLLLYLCTVFRALINSVVWKYWLNRKTKENDMMPGWR